MVMPVSVPVKLLVPKPSSQGFANSVVAAPSARDKPASSMSDDEMPVLVRMTLSPPHSPQGAVPCTPAVSCCSAPRAWGGNIPLLSWRWGQLFQCHWPELRNGVASQDGALKATTLGIPSLPTLPSTQENLLFCRADGLG